MAPDSSGPLDLPKQNDVPRTGLVPDLEVSMGWTQMACGLMPLSPRGLAALSQMEGLAMGD